MGSQQRWYRTTAPSSAVSSSKDLHTTTSPHYPKANGEVERAVQTVKKLWRKNDDKHLALLNYRTTSLPDIDLCPAQLLMGRRLRNKLPMMEGLLQPASNNQQEISRYLEKTKESQKKYHDRHASKLGYERTPAWNQSSHAALDKFQSLETSHCSQTSPYTKILCGAG